MRTQRGGTTFFKARSSFGRPLRRPIPAPLRLPRPMLLLLVIGVSTACGGKEPSPGGEACENHVPLAGFPATPIRARIGRLTIRDQKDRRVDPVMGAASSEVGLIQGSFFDVSAQTSTAAVVLEFPEIDGTAGSCIGRVSRATVGGTRRGLMLSGLSVEGTSLGTLEVPSTALGVYVYTGDPLIVEQRLLRAVGQASDDFPGFDVTVSALEPMNVLAPDPRGDDELGFADLTVAWTAGTGDLVQIVIDPTDEPSTAESGGQVTCLVPDDGCYVIPSSAIEFLLASGATRFDLSIERQRIAGAFPADDAYVGVEVTSEMMITVKNGVLVQ
ncbi:MAG: hypothetical protein IPK13_13220 [Deltaproteobacteria bacterium]|nr:hypothetical protein [Deltaproteobacteria bacterium]